MRLRFPAVLALPCVLATAIVLASSAGVARADTGAVTFGPDLSTLNVNNADDCSVNPFIMPPLNNYNGAPSCTWTSNDPTTSLNGQLPPDGEGTISQVMIKVGAVTGPMQVVIMQSEWALEDAGQPDVHYSISCCVDVAESGSFTPAANAITTVPVNLPVEVDSSPNPDNGLLTVDFVGLSVLEDGVPVPAADETSLPILDQPDLFVEQPAMQDNGGVQLAGDGTGYLVAMDSVWNPSSSPAPTPPPNPGPNPNPNPGLTPTPNPGTTPNPGPITTTHPTPIFTFPTGANLARVTGNNALVKVACGAGGAACDGKVSIQSAKAGGAGAHIARAAKVVTYATGSFALTAGKNQSVKAKLSRAGRTLAAHHKTIKVWINVTLTSGKVMSRQITLRF